MGKIIRIGTRESQLAVWQATQVKTLLAQFDFDAELVYIKSEGDLDLKTPLYEMGVQGVFTRSLDIALLNDKIDLAVHSMKDVPTQSAKGIVQAAVLKRGSYKDVFVPHPDLSDVHTIFGRGVIEEKNISVTTSGSKKEEQAHTDYINTGEPVNAVIATSSIRRKAQWLNRYPHHKVETLRGNVNTRLHKLKESNWHGAIFAAAGLERIDLLPKNSIELDWMLPAPAQGAIMVVCRDADDHCLDACSNFNDAGTALCTKIERDFLKILLGGCSTPISALAEIVEDKIHLKGNILSPDGKQIAGFNAIEPVMMADDLGVRAAEGLLKNGGQSIADSIRYAG
ncbi:MAG TPA: hydroxymethylbilane synthase [Chitinophagaceae bacterium]|nr:hydroxymethylbilane synthase [Chitinophagaceae bacterium]